MYRDRDGEGGWVGEVMGRDGGCSVEGSVLGIGNWAVMDQEVITPCRNCQLQQWLPVSCSSCFLTWVLSGSEKNGWG